MKSPTNTHTHSTHKHNVSKYNKAYHGFGHAKFPDSGSVLGLSLFSILPHLPLKMMVGLKVVKINSKISNSLC